MVYVYVMEKFIYYFSCSWTELYRGLQWAVTIIVSANLIMHGATSGMPTCLCFHAIFFNDIRFRLCCYDIFPCRDRAVAILEAVSLKISVLVIWYFPYYALIFSTTLMVHVYYVLIVVLPIIKVIFITSLFCSKATTLEGSFAPAWLGFGNAYAAQDESDQAMAAYRTAARLFAGYCWFFL
jgi:hypothetical protein